MYDRDPDGLPVPATASGIWLTERLRGLGTVYSMPFAVTFHGSLDEPALLAACRAVTERHPTLCSAVVERQGVPVRVPAALPPVPVVIDLTASPESAAAFEREEIARPFDTERGPLIRFTLLRTAPDTARLLVVAHHLVFDGTSTSILLDDLAAAYAGKALPEPDPEPDPLDLEDRIAEALPGARRFWQRHWAEPEDVSLPGLRAQPRPTAPGSAVTRRLDDGLRASVADCTRRLGMTAFQFTVASWLVLLHRYGNRRPVLGADFGTRGREDRERIGPWVNELPVSGIPDPAESFRSFAGRLVFDQGLRSDLRGLYHHREVPLARAVPGIRPAVALAPVTLGYRRREAAPVFPGVEAEVDWALPNRTARGALRVHMVDGPESWSLALHHDPEVLEHAFAERITDQWTELARTLAEQTDTALGDLPFASDEPGLVAAWNRTARPWPDTTLPTLFAEQAARTPDAVAVSDAEGDLTYRQLTRRAADLGMRLHALGVGPDALVALAIPRSTAALVAQLAVLGLGAAYLPLDPAHPAARLAELVADSGAVLVLTDGGAPDGLAADGVRVLDLRRLPDAPAAVAPAPAPRPGDLAYVLYTSGSTGRPKGVEVEHRALVNLLMDFRDRLGAGDAHRWLALTALTFDICALELFLPLVTGGRVVMAPADAAKDARTVAALVRGHGVTHVQATPSGWQALLDAGLPTPGLTVLVGGEVLPTGLAHALVARATRVLNVYGPTETTIWSTAAELDAAAEPTIGAPLANTTVHVLDEDGLPVPIGLAGELWIGGVGVARGYLNRPALTADRFRPDPDGPPGSRRYRTGDLVRRRLDGGLDFVGRLDGQIKLRGHRIETGEIETRLLEHPAVASAAVSAVGTDPELRLVAHIVPAGVAPAPEDLAAYLRERLPAVMVPTEWSLLDAMPLTPNGKVDRVALRKSAAAPAAAAEPARDEPEADPTAEAVRAIWVQVLGVPGVGLEEDLFDLGGHSLTVAQIAARISAVLGVDLPLHVFYDDATVRGMAEAVDRARGRR
ncbi:amino acid adenylation domain-containing protein [Streptomyces sp. NPDC048623]|uniref:non-ribosomal peptide synthetase n=1 Tax=Streptomyces sp. NPDC048623 TaxID=3155761 RepID=UPI00341C016F